MSKSKYIRVTEVAKLIRQSLKEAFPGVKFSVRSDQYSGGASIGVSWADGPSNLQVKAITGRFASTFHNWERDYWEHLWHRLNGELVSFGSHHVQCVRRYSDAWCADAIETAYALHADLLRARGIDAPKVIDFFDGRMHKIPLNELPPEPDDGIGDIPFGDGSPGPRYRSMHDAVRDLLSERTGYASPNTSATALSVTLLAADNPTVSPFDAGWAAVTH